MGNSPNQGADYRIGYGVRARWQEWEGRLKLDTLQKINKQFAVNKTKSWIQRWAPGIP